MLETIALGQCVSFGLFAAHIGAWIINGKYNFSLVNVNNQSILWFMSFHRNCVYTYFLLENFIVFV